ncbi:synaptonemal complex protein 2-like isoform X1 [Engystomops pustulosus]|uniref:synaptonemal complex protein 2-like isoform X1 n=1 Tax=Engystomops pustulosus TaxID=76066 RepID=UPI003AFB1BFA
MSVEEKFNPAEKMNVHTEFYLETLISDAFKGKGFQKISELFEEKSICSSQRHSKALLNQLDRLINKELDRNEFKHVSLLMKCIQHFCKSECHEGWSLIQQGLVSKMVLWFERTLEFLKICEGSSSSISTLVEDFYDTALVICECNSEDGVKQLLDTFLFTLGFITMKKWPPYQVRLEAVKTFNFIIDKTSREERKKLNSSEEMCTLMQGLAKELFEAGDYDIQVTITEALCRMTTKKIRDNLAQKWFEDGIFAEAFKAINDKDFETDCRKFLNFLNSRLKDTNRVHTFPCINVSTDVGELTKPQDDKLENFWIDFNTGSHGISFYVHTNKGCHWEPVRLQKESLSGYNLEECSGYKQLSIHLVKPQSINNEEVKRIKMSFELEHDIQNAAVNTYGEELQMEGCKKSLIQTNIPSARAIAAKSVNDQRNRIQSNISVDGDSSCTSFSINDQSSITNLTIDENAPLSSPSVTDKSNYTHNPLDTREEASSGEVSALVAGDTPRVLEFSEESKLSDVSGKNLKTNTNETKEHQQNQLLEEKKAFDVFDFPKSPGSPSDFEVSVVKEKVVCPVYSPKRKTNNTPGQKRVQSCQKSETKKQAVDYKDFVSSESETSWSLEFRRKPLTKSADYSRKKQKGKTRLKVLPLSSQSSDDEKKAKKMGQPLEYTEMKTGRQRGVAESLSFSELKLPGISALLTPRHSQPHTSGTLHLSDLDEDAMDPLQEMSSPEILKVEKNQQTRNSKMGFKGNEDQMKLLRGLYPSGKTEDARKRKRSSSDEEEEVIIKPRKLFSSGNVTDNEVFKSDSHESDITECSFVSSFESFTKGLRRKMMARYKRMEVRAKDVLKTSHHHVSSLMNQIQQSNFRKLDHFCKVVAQELSSLDTETQALKELEKETLDFWEAQTVKINEFCTNQKQRIEAMDCTIQKSLSDIRCSKTKKEEKNTDAKESLQTL